MSDPPRFFRDSSLFQDPEYLASSNGKKRYALELALDIDKESQRSYDKEKTLAEVARHAFVNSEEYIQQQEARQAKEADYAQKVQDIFDKLEKPEVSRASRLSKSELK